MSAIVARTAAGVEPAENAAAARGILDAMSARGTDVVEQWCDALVAFASSRWSWESGSGQHIAVQGPRAVVADATLYYRDDLVRAMTDRGVRPASTSPADLILAAHAAFGDDCVDHLEGDYAFVLWDGQRRRLFAARDFGGKRPLYFSCRGDALTVASTVGGVVTDARVPRDVDLVSVATVAAGMWCHGGYTCYEAVSELPGGHTLACEPGGAPVIEQSWKPPQRIAKTAPDGGAEELRDLLTRATAERLAPDAPTAVTLSGGRDSTAVYGAAHNALRGARDTRSIVAVSVSYPQGDPGYEDDYIAETTAFWNATPTWLRIDDIPMFDPAASRDVMRDEPWAHPFEQWNRALFRASREQGAHVALDGFGGDQLFQVSDVYLADLLRDGRWLELARQWRTRQARGARNFYRHAVRPRLSERSLQLLARVRGMGTPRHYLDRTPPPWFRHSFLKQHGVIERDVAARPELPRNSAVLAETHVFLTFHNFARISGRLASFALSESVELRSPLLDNRVVQFAAGRPWYERVNGADTKILLRQSMRGLLPERVLAPRSHRTGVTTGYFTRCLTGAGAALVDDVVAGSRLAELGVIDVNTLRRAWDYFVGSSDTELGSRIFFTLMAERWLRAHT